MVRRSGDLASFLRLSETSGTSFFHQKSPVHRDGFLFGYVFRVVTAVLAVLFPVVLLLFAHFITSIPKSVAIGFLTVNILGIVLTGEHLRSTVYDRTQKTNKPRPSVSFAVTFPQQEKTDFEALSIGMLLGKRAFDILVSVMGLVLLAPLMILASTLILLENPGAILVRTAAMSRGGSVFKQLRFRITTRDGRESRIGAYLHRSRIDELPQLLNVLRGHMSIVGFTPVRARDADGAAQSFMKLAMKRGLKPGIISMARITQSAIPRLNRRETIVIDTEYLRNWSLSLDLRLLIGTVTIIIRGRELSSGPPASTP